MTCNSYTHGIDTISFQPKISGKFIGKEKPDSIGVAVLSRFLQNPLTFKIKVGKQGDFTFNLPKSKNIQRFMIKKITKGIWGEIGQYYAEQNDDIFIRVLNEAKDSLTFSGRGAPKYNLISDINKDYKRFIFESEKKYPFIFTYQNCINYLDDKIKYVKIFNEKKFMSLKMFDKTVSSDIRKIIEFQFAGYFSNWNDNLRSLYLRECIGKPEFELLVRNYFDKFKNDSFLKLDDRVSIFSPTGLLTFSLWYKTSLTLNSKNGLINLADYYRLIKDNSSGQNRDALLTMFFLHSSTFTDIKDFNSNTYDSLILDAQHCITSLDAKNIISAKAKTRAGSILYEANFIDSEGKYVSTSSLKDKVVFIDFWGDGCTGCLIFHQWFEKNIWPQFKDNKDFVVLSVSIDKNKERWLNSIDKYSSREYVNVNTGGLVLDHPFCKYYNIQSLPSLMLVGKHGRILSQINLGISSVDLIRLIKSGLDKKMAR